MASGDVVGLILDVMPPSTGFATPDILPGADSVAAEAIPVWDFDGGTALEHLDFKVMLHGYDGGGLTITLPWSASAATSGEVIWQCAIRAIPSDAEDLDTTDHAYDYNQVEDAAPSAVGEVVYADITFTDGADMDSWANGQLAIVRILRDPTATTPDDDMSGDAELHAIIIKES